MTTTCSLKKCYIPRSRFLELATCGPSFVTEFTELPEPVPVEGDAYASLEVLISLMAMMSMRYGLRPEEVRKVCNFVRLTGIDQLNEQLQKGQTFLFVPTNHQPRFVSQNTSLQELRDPSNQILRGATGGTHGYPGLLLDLAAFVEEINEKLNVVSGSST